MDEIEQREGRPSDYVRGRQAYEASAPPSLEPSRSSVAIEQNSKGEPAVKLKHYEGTPEGVLMLLAVEAVRVYQWTVGEVGA